MVRARWPPPIRLSWERRGRFRHRLAPWKHGEGGGGGGRRVSLSLRIASAGLHRPLVRGGGVEFVAVGAVQNHSVQDLGLVLRQGHVGALAPGWQPQGTPLARRPLARQAKGVLVIPEVWAFGILAPSYVTWSRPFEANPWKPRTACARMVIGAVSSARHVFGKMKKFG